MNVYIRDNFVPDDHTLKYKSSYYKHTYNIYTVYLMMDIIIYQKQHIQYQQ